MTLSLLWMLPLALAFDQAHPDLDALLRAHVSGGSVDYQGLATQAPALDAYIAALSTTNISGFSQAQAKAFWINAYNALTLDLVVDSLPLKSILDLDGGKVWDTRTWTVAGRQVTLNEIEHKILRPLGDPRIHAAINCASKGCPPLGARAFTASGLDGQLEQAVKGWARGNGVVVKGDRVGLNNIFDWFGDDFIGGYGPGRFDIPGVEGKPEAAINFLAPYLDAETRAKLLEGGYQTYWTNYDWALNKR